MVSISSTHINLGGCEQTLSLGMMKIPTRPRMAFMVLTHLTGEHQWVFQDFQHHTPSPGWSVLRLCLENSCCPSSCSFCSTAILVLSVLLSSSNMFPMALLSSSVAPWSECLAKPWHLAKQWPLNTLFWQIFMSSLYLALFLLNASSSWSSRGTVSSSRTTCFNDSDTGTMSGLSVVRAMVSGNLSHLSRLTFSCQSQVTARNYPVEFVSCCCFSPALTKAIKHFAVCFAVWWKRSLHRWPLR